MHNQLEGYKQLGDIKAKALGIISFALYLITLPPNSLANTKPLWELGAGLGFYSTPHYLGSDQRRDYILPIPYAIYRGEYIRSSRGGLVGHIYDSDKLDLRLSLGGSLPVNSENNKAREGMPDLDLVLEAGGNMQVSLWQNPEQSLRFDLPLRAAFSVSNEMRYRGIISNPALVYRYQGDHWKFSLSGGPRFSSQKYHAYIYSVKAPYATLDRPEYKAKAGFTGFRASSSISRRFGRLYLGAFLNYYDLQQAENKASPLFKQKDYVSYGLAMSWVFSESRKQVGVELD